MTANRESRISHLALSDTFRTFPRVGQNVGQASDPHFDPHIFKRFCNKKPRNLTISGLFWSCWADSNCRPHPYQGCALPTELQQQMATRKGLEPSTSGVTGRRSNQLNYRAIYHRTGFPANLIGRGRRIRTLGTRFWRPLLYQLSYTPISCMLIRPADPKGTRRSVPTPRRGLVGLQGLEPGTNRL